jgi:hypothetical protein
MIKAPDAAKEHLYIAFINVLGAALAASTIWMA